MTIPEPTSPGDALRELLDERGISQSQAAQALGLSRGHLNSIINGHNPISADLKLKLERYLKVPAQHWTRLQERHDAYAETPEGRELILARQRRAFLDQLQLHPQPLLPRALIASAVECGWLGVEPSPLPRLTHTGMWLTLGLQGVVTRQKDPALHPQETTVVLKPRFDLPPGAVLTVLTHETIHLPEGLEMRVSTVADAFCSAQLSLRCRTHFESGLNGPLSLQIVNESGRPQSLRCQDPVVHVQFEHHPDGLPTVPD